METSTTLVPREQWLITSLQVTFIPCQRATSEWGLWSQGAGICMACTEACRGSHHLKYPACDACLDRWSAHSAPMQNKLLKMETLDIRVAPKLGMSLQANALQFSQEMYGSHLQMRPDESVLCLGHIEPRCYLESPTLINSHPDRPPAASGDHYPMYSPQIWVALVGLCGSLW